MKGDGWALEGSCKTATDLGGDHFEWFKLDSGKILITIGDVSGHGVASAMVQASTKVWMALKSRNTEDPSQILGEINRLHFEQGVRKLPMTCWVGIFDPEKRMIEYASAGQSYPIFVDNSGNAEFLKLPGMPLGVRKKFQPQNATLDLSLGGNLVLYTDGLVESPNAGGEILGYDRFIKICSEVVGLSANQAMDYIFQKTFDWDCGHKIDDQTVVVLTVKDIEGGEQK
jgi:sigma-B regulation protein RsbU (phosphoserine phosphatase)